MKIYTRKGDRGRTKLFGGDEVGKNDARVNAYGTLDELNAVIGAAIALDPDDGLGTRELGPVQEDLLVIGARLAAARPSRERERGTIPELPGERVAELESWIDRLDAELPALDSFILPGGSAPGAQLHVARTVCRRVERAVAALAGEQPDLRDNILPYINRLSDLLFTLARAVNHRAGRPESRWTPMRRRQATPAAEDESGTK